MIAHRSIGSKQPKNEEVHGVWPVGAVISEWSLAVASTRCIQPSMSRCISDLAIVIEN